MARLLLLYLSRSAFVYIGSAAFLALAWVLPPSGFSAQWNIAWALVVAYLTGPGPSSKDVRSPELAVLPVSWRDRWRVRWILATLPPLFVTAIGQAAGLAIALVLTLPHGNA